MNQELPRVNRWRIIRNALKIVKNPLPILMGFVKEKGESFYIYQGAIREAIITIDPEVIQHVMQKNNRNYRKSEIQTEMIGQFAGKGLLTSDGDYWLQQRRLIQPGFHRAKLAALAQVMLQVVKSACCDLDKFAEQNKTFDLTHEMTKIAFQVVAKSLFTSSVTDEELLVLSDNTQTVQEYIIRRIRQPYLAWWFNLSGKHRQIDELSKESRKLILKIIQERRKGSTSHDDLLDMLLESRYEGTDQGMTDTQLLDESLILFVAGHETSANALSWAFYLLCKHPEATEKIRAEYAEVVGDRAIEFSDLPKLSYTSKVIQETMRIYPPAWITDRLANEEDEVKGIKIPKDKMVTPFIYGVHHSPKYWKDPEEFRPERFEKENMKGKPMFAYMPFGGGPRLCIGNNFAMMEMQLVVLELLKRYDFTLEENQIIEPMPFVTLQPKYGIKVKIKKRE